MLENPASELCTRQACRASAGHVVSRHDIDILFVLISGSVLHTSSHSACGDMGGPATGVSGPPAVASMRVIQARAELL